MSRIERPLPGLLLLAALSVASLAGCGGDDSRSGAAASAGLLFVRDDAGGVPDLMHARISNGEVRALTSTASRAERRPLWVRGQQRILFESSRAAPRDPPRLVLLDPATGILTYTRRDPGLTGLTFAVWTSTDLATWTEDTGAAQSPGTLDANSVESVSVTISASLLTNPRLYFKICASE